MGSGLIPRPEEEDMEEKGPGFSHSRMRFYLWFKHVLMSGRVLMTPSKSHGRFGAISPTPILPTPILSTPISPTQLKNSF